MAKLTLYRLPVSSWFDKNAIVYGTRREYYPRGDEYSPRDPRFTALHGACRYNDGEKSLPGAYDPVAQERKVELPYPLLTNEDRKPNRYGWCVGDIGICKKDGPTCRKGALIQLERDDNSDCPYWRQISGPRTCFSDGTFSVYHHHIQHIDLPDHLVTTKEESPMYIRNPFQVGDKVIVNGFKFRGGQHKYGTTSSIERWAKDATVITVTATIPERTTAGTDTLDLAFHPSELRMATEAEIKATTAQKLPELHHGMLIKMNGKVGMVKHPQPDDDGDLRVALVTGGECYFRVAKDDAQHFTILGRIMPDGDFRPAESTSTSAIDQDPRTWKPGDKLRCGSNESSYLTEGRVYEIESIDIEGGNLVIKCEDDGTPGRRSLASYSWVKVA